VITFSLALKPGIHYHITAGFVVVVKNSFKLQCYFSITNYTGNISPFPPPCLNLWLWTVIIFLKA